MTQFRQRPGTKSTVLQFNNPIRDETAFQEIIQSLLLRNPLGCTSYRSAKKNNPPIQKVREQYTAKFVYMDAKGKRIGSGSEVYNTIDGYQSGIAAVISNMANIASHGGKVKHITGTDLFSVTMKCHDPHDGLYFLSFTRNQVTLSSYSNEAIRERVEKWTNSVPALV